MKKLVIGGMLIALNIVLPYVFHFVPGGGKLFLPMHFGVLIAGLLLGPVYGIAIGITAPFLGMVTTGMPQMPMTVFMTFELAAYGACSGGFSLLFRKTGLSEIWNIYLSLVLSMVAGRLVYAGILLVSGFVTSGTAPAVITVFTSFLAGLPGVAVQLLLIPVIVLSIQKAVRMEQPAETPVRY